MANVELLNHPLGAMGKVKAAKVIQMRSIAASQAQPEAP
jgi:hypothetical protein